LKIIFRKKNAELHGINQFHDLLYTIRNYDVSTHVRIRKSFTKYTITFDKQPT
jgi:hypothetical protein